jgi:hypothetical protein
MVCSLLLASGDSFLGPNWSCCVTYIAPFVGSSTQDSLDSGDRFVQDTERLPVVRSKIKCQGQLLNLNALLRAYACVFGW